MYLLSRLILTSCRLSNCDHAVRIPETAGVTIPIEVQHGNPGHLQLVFGGEEDIEKQLRCESVQLSQVGPHPTGPLARVCQWL